MPDQSTGREPIKFGPDLGIVATEELDAEAIGNFLDTDPEEVETPPVAKPKPKTNTPPAKTPPAKQPPAKETTEQTEETEEAAPSPEELVEELFKEGEEEEGTEGEEGNEEGQEGEENNNTEEEDNPFVGLTKDLVDLGIFTLDEGEETLDIQSDDEFKERFEYEKRKGAGQAIEAYLSRFGPEYSEMFTSVFVKGVNPIEYLTRYAKIEDLKNFDLKNEDNQERIVRAKLLKDGLTPDEAAKRIDKLRNYNDLEEEAGIAHRLMLKQEEDGKAEDERKKAEQIQKKAEKKQAFSSKVNQILSEKVQSKEWDGIPVDLKFAQEVQEYLTKEKFRVGTEDYISEFDKEIQVDLNKPENYELKVKVAMLLKLLKVDPKLTKIQKKAVTQESKKLFQHIKQSGSKGKQANNQEQNKQKEAPTSWWGK